MKQLPDRLSNDNFMGPGVNMLRDKINEILEYLETSDDPEATDLLSLPGIEKGDCLHEDHWRINKGVIKCRTCGLAVRKPL